MAQGARLDPKSVYASPSSAQLIAKAIPIHCDMTVARITATQVWAKVLPIYVTLFTTRRPNNPNVLLSLELLVGLCRPFILSIPTKK